MSEEKTESNLDGFQFLNIERALWLDPGLSMQEKCLMAYIESLASKVGYCYAKDCQFAEFLQIKERGMQKHLGNLEKKGYITREVKRQKVNGEFVATRKIYSHLPAKIQEYRDKNDQSKTHDDATKLHDSALSYMHDSAGIKQNIKQKETKGNSALNERQQAAPPVPKQKDSTNHPYRFFEIINEHRSEPMAATAKELGQCKNLVKYANKDEDTLRRKIQLYQADPFWSKKPITAATLSTAWNGLEGKAPGEKSGWAAEFDKKMNGES